MTLPRRSRTISNLHHWSITDGLKNFGADISVDVRYGALGSI